MRKAKSRQCDNCQRLVSLSNYNNHYASCVKKSLKVEEIQEWKKTENGDCKCLICQKTYSPYGIKNHIKYHYGHQNVNLGRPSPMKGLTKETSERVRKTAETCKARYASGELVPHNIGKKHTEATREKWRNNPNMGGLRKGSGRGKKGTYQDYYCDSTWELAWVIWHLDHGSKFLRNTESFEYEFDGKKHRYFPDFIMDDIYYEVKGEKTKQWEAKVLQFPIHLILSVVDKHDIGEYLKYAQEKFGKEFWVVAYGDTFKCDDKPTSTARTCTLCGDWKDTCSKKCQKCYDKQKEAKVDWGMLDLVEIMRKNDYNYSKVGKLLGVSNTTVKKHFKQEKNMDEDIVQLADIWGLTVQRETLSNLLNCGDFVAIEDFDCTGTLLLRKEKGRITLTKTNQPFLSQVNKEPAKIDVVHDFGAYREVLFDDSEPDGGEPFEIGGNRYSQWRKELKPTLKDKECMKDYLNRKFRE